MEICISHVKAGVKGLSERRGQLEASGCLSVGGFPTHSLASFWVLLRTSTGGGALHTHLHLLTFTAALGWAALCWLHNGRWELSPMTAQAEAGTAAHSSWLRGCAPDQQHQTKTGTLSCLLMKQNGCFLILSIPCGW